MTGLPIVVACLAGLGASLLARRLAVYCQAAVGGRNLLPQIVGDLQKLASGTDTSSFLAEYVQLLRRLGRLAGTQLAKLSIQLVTLTAAYAATCWPLDDGSGTHTFNPFWHWISDVEWTFLLAATVGSLLAPLVVRSPA